MASDIEIKRFIENEVKPLPGRMEALERAIAALAENYNSVRADMEEMKKREDDEPVVARDFEAEAHLKKLKKGK